MAAPPRYNVAMRHEAKEKIALWRLGVLGPLISARLEHGDRRCYLEEAAARLQQQPDGTYVQLSARTIESWYYAYRHGGFQALFPQDRADRGRSRAIGAPLAEQILRVKRERPRRSIRRIIRCWSAPGSSPPAVCIAPVCIACSRLITCPPGRCALASPSDAPSCPNTLGICG